MGVYQRDNIQYNNMIDAAIRNRLEGAKVRSDAQRKQGEIWGGTVKNLGGMAARYMDYANANRESPEARLKALEEELRQAEIEKKYNEQVAQRRALDRAIAGYPEYKKELAEAEAKARNEYINNAAKTMAGYRSNMTGYGDYMNRMSDIDALRPYIDEPIDTNEYLKVIEDDYRRRV
jgi:hypothetical protein